MDVTALRDLVTARGADITSGGVAVLAGRVRDAARDIASDAVTTGPVVLSGSVWGTSIGVNWPTTVWQWVTGDPSHPFDPHHDADLDGATFDATSWRETLAKDPGVFPEGNDFWFPGDHPGCRCTIETVLGTDPPPVGPGSTPTSRTVRAGGVTVTLTKDNRPVGTATFVPDWWASVVTDEGWASALTEAQR